MASRTPPLQSPEPGVEPASDFLVAEAVWITEALRELSRYVARSTTDVEARAGLTGPQIRAVTVVFDRGPLSLKALSRELGLTHSTASGIVARLERRGLIQRVVDPGDRRVSLIQVTDVVDVYARRGFAELQTSRLLPVLQSADDAQRRAIRDGLAVLQALVKQFAASDKADGTHTS